MRATEYKVLEFDNMKYHFVCKHRASRHPWWIQVSYRVNLRYREVRKFTRPQTFLAPWTSIDHTQLDINVIAGYIIDIIKKNLTFCIEVLRGRMERVGSLTPTPYLHPCEFDSNLVSWDQCLTASLPRIYGERPESRTRYFGCTPVTLFKRSDTACEGNGLSTTTTKVPPPERVCHIFGAVAGEAE
ncbi:hypothetical protein PIB30_016255 [Stylosanthes scabra]|uniref:Uncharacterized protein n=1 Tax=Stylosanthes scabra TaxID=79078 RepID=A0ABU6Y492_9FABA|nr:hypothetical protein [Stylosanthes scabra]